MQINSIFKIFKKKNPKIKNCFGKNISQEFNWNKTEYFM